MNSKPNFFYFDDFLADESLLTYLLEKHGSDKGSSQEKEHPSGWKYHSYSFIYSLLLSPIRENTHKVMEIGIGTNNPNIPSSMGVNGTPGASLRAWRDFFFKRRNFWSRY